MATKTKQVRWTCPNGCAGVLGPSRPRRDDVRRYCLTCSAKTGRLVERTAPALEKARATKAQAAAEKRKTAAARAKAKEAERWTVEGVDLRDVLDKALTLPSLKAARGASFKSLYRTEYGVSGRAWPWQNHFHLSVSRNARASKAVAVLIHEVAHLACYRAGEPYGDADVAFGKRCTNALDEWNDKYGAKVVEVNRRGHGAPYRGKIARGIRAAARERKSTD